MKKLLLIISLAVIFGCGGENLSFTNIVQTQTAENMLGNATATAIAEVTECTAEQGIVYSSLSETATGIPLLPRKPLTLFMFLIMW